MLDLDERQKNIVQAILKRYLPQVTVWAFGSRVEGRAHKASDLDLTVLT